MVNEITKKLTESSVPVLTNSDSEISIKHNK